MRAAIYVRISQDPTGLRAGVERQESDCRAYCTSLGCDDVELYVDNDISAFSGRVRPAYRRLLDDIRAGRKDLVVAWHLDRLHRQPRELEEFIEVAEAARIALKTLQGDVDLSTSSGRLHARIMGAVARHESEHKSERVKRKARELAEQGKLSGGGRRMFGYSPDGQTIVESEAALIREAAERVISGASPRSVAEDWKRRGVKTSYGGRWTSQSVKSLLSSPRLASLRLVDGRAVSGSWPAILSGSTHGALQAALRAREVQRPGRPPSYLLSGFASCGVCEYPLYGKTEGTKRRAYVCLTASGGCGKISVLADRVDSLVWEYVAREIESQGPWRERESLVDDSELKLARVKLERLEDGYLSGLFDKDSYAKRRRELVSEIVSLEGQVFQSIVGPKGDIDVRSWLAEADLDTRRELVKRSLLGVRVDPGKPGRFDPSRVVLLVESIGLSGPEVTEL